MSTPPVPGTVNLFWIPLGAGAHGARIGGAIYEAVVARVQRRDRCHLYHSALEIHVPEGRYVVEQTPVAGSGGERRGVVAVGAVGTRWVGRFRLFQYEIRRWLSGSIPDLDQAVASPVVVAQNLATAREVLGVLPSIPTPVWGRDELGAGEMWNSNSVVSWALSRAGIDLTDVRPPSGGRAPGWSAGMVVAAREPAPRTST